MILSNDVSQALAEVLWHISVVANKLSTPYYIVRLNKTSESRGFVCASLLPVLVRVRVSALQFVIIFSSFSTMPSSTQLPTPEPPKPINPYDVLDVPKDATEDQVKKAYRKAALKHHPGTFYHVQIFRTITYFAC